MNTKIDNRTHYILKREVIKLNNIIEVKENFFNSQATTKAGKYKLQLIPLNKIDVIIKGIATREFFTWENPEHIDNIKLNFHKTGPVILEEFNNQYYSVDGHHRITAANELGLINILSFVIKVDKLSYIR